MDLILDEPLLSADDEVALARGIEAGLLAAELLATRRTVRGASPAELRALVECGRADRDRFVRANLRLVAGEARAHARRHRLPEDELFQEGAAGLVLAVDRFDHARGLRFATYALPWIRSYIAKAVARRCGELHLTDSGAESRRVVRSTARRLADTLGREPTAEEVAAQLGRSVEVVAALLAHSGPTSLTRLTGDEVDRPDPAAQESFDAVERELSPVCLPLHVLRPEERRVVALRYGLDDGRARSFADAARALGMPATRVRRREAAALARLRACVALDERPAA